MSGPVREIERIVNYCDTDAGGVVYYARYLEFFEAGRMDYLHAIGCDPIECHRQGIFFAVREVHATYKASARLGHRLTVRSAVSETTRFHMTFHSEILDSSSGKVLVESDIKCVCVSPEGKLLRLPEAIARAQS